MEMCTIQMLLFLCSISSVFMANKEQNSQDLYQILDENKAILNAKTFHQENASSEIECLLKVRRHDRKACFIQMESTTSHQGSKWLCGLFETSAKDSLAIHYKKNSKIYKSVTSCGKAAARDCLDWYERGYKKDGVYEIEINGIVKKVICLMEKFQPGWTVIQKRLDGSVSFNRTWQEYKDGFGNAEGEYWLGNEMLYLLTQVNSKIRIEGHMFNGKEKFVTAVNFWIENESNYYKLHAGTHGYGNLSLFSNWAAHDGMPFSVDPNNNPCYFKNYMGCSQQCGGGWWFRPWLNNCQEINLNGPFTSQKKYSTDEILADERSGIIWQNLLGASGSLKSTEIAVIRMASGN